MIESLPAQVKVQIILFSEKAVILTPLTADRQILKKGIGKIDYGNGTSLYETIHAIFPKLINPAEGRKVVVLLTDGVDTTSQVSY